VADLRRCVDELKFNLLSGIAGSLRDECLSQSNHSLLRSYNAALDHNEVLVHNTIVREASNRSNTLGGKIEFSATVGGSSLANTVHLLVDLSAVVISVLSSAGNSPRHSWWMPCSDTGDLSETSVGLSWQTSSAPSSGHTLKSFTLGVSDDVEHLTISEDSVNWYLLLEQADSEVDLLSCSSSINLDFQEVSSLRSQLELSDLGMGHDSNNSAILLYTVKLSVDLILVLGKLLSVLGECLLLGSVPILVEAALHFVTQVRCPHSGQSAHALGSGDVANDTNYHQWRALDNGHSLHNFLLVDL